MFYYNYKYIVFTVFLDFFDAGVMSSASTSKVSEEEQKPSKISEALPEGFFDDPKMDAKVFQIFFILF